MSHFNVQEFIDRQPIRPAHYLVVVLCGLAMFIDGFDVFIIGKIAPAIAAGLGESAAAMTPVFLSQQIGLAIGAFGATPLADKYGRKRMLVISFMIFGLLTLSTAFATTLDQIVVLRGLASVFLAGGVPMVLSIVTEAIPQKQRGRFIAYSLIAYSFGSAAGSAVAAWLLDGFGWQIGFWVGGLMPLVLVPFLLWLLPESLQFVVTRNANDPRIPAMLRRIDRSVELRGDEIFATGDGSRSVSKTRLSDIFRDGRARTTALLWLASMLSLGNIALMSAWLPTFFQEMAGIPIQRFAIYSMIAYSGGLVGTLTMGWLLDRFGPARVIPAYYFGFSAAMVAIAFVPFEAAIFIVILILFNFCMTGAQTGLNTFTAMVYPASMRSTGLGWTSGAGRIGGIISPIFGGFAIASQFSLQLTMSIVAVLPFAAGSILLLIRHQKHQPQVQTLQEKPA